MALNVLGLALTFLMPWFAERDDALRMHRMPQATRIGTGGVVALITLASPVFLVLLTVVNHGSAPWAVVVSAVSLLLLVVRVHVAPAAGGA